MSLFEKRVEAAAREIWKADNTTLGIDPPESMEAWEEEAEGYLELARAALLAADAVVTEEELERVLSGAFQGWTDQDDPFGDQARAVLALFRGGEINV